MSVAFLMAAAIQSAEFHEDEHLQTGLEGPSQPVNRVVVVARPPTAAFAAVASAVTETRLFPKQQ